MNDLSRVRFVVPANDDDQSPSNPFLEGRSVGGSNHLHRGPIKGNNPRALAPVVVVACRGPTAPVLAEVKRDVADVAEAMCRLGRW
jgi:hypothetical protein